MESTADTEIWSHILPCANVLLLNIDLAFDHSHLTRQWRFSVRLLQEPLGIELHTLVPLVVVMFGSESTVPSQRQLQKFKAQLCYQQSQGACLAIPGGWPVWV